MSGDFLQDSTRALIVSPQGSKFFTTPL